MEQLKPCPFCGNTPLIAQCSPFRGRDWIVSCESTCLVGPATNNLAKDEAIAAWNTRATMSEIINETQIVRVTDRVTIQGSLVCTDNQNYHAFAGRDAERRAQLFAAYIGAELAAREGGK